MSEIPPDRRFVCVHGHFYQPPRENPWLEEVEREESAHPHHDWNERIFHECYGPNLAAPILDPEGAVVQLVNNYERISFNFGPTLLSWLERRHPPAYRRLLDADKRSVQARGHGNALAQVYNHVIMPLAGARDKLTQVRWGLADFEYRFGRKAEGMWLAETAADDETLEALAEEGVRFTVLAPHQAARVRPLGAADWTPVGADSVDTTRAYRWSSKRRPDRQLALFFYHGPLSRAVAFERALSDGADFGRRLASGFLDEDRPQLVHIATDGESYGHHHRFGEMGLAFALEWLERSGAAKLANYAQFLELAPPAFEAEIAPRTAWSCAHGVGRWSEDCGCRIHGSWHQKWRGPLRESLDWLASELDHFYEAQAEVLFRDPWKARDAYIGRLLSGEARPLFDRHALKHLSAAEAHRALALLEMQRHRLLMFTSCGWFFDDVSGIETQQVLKYAARALELARGLGKDAERAFLERLEHAPSNLPQFRDGRTVYARLAAARRVDLVRAAANAAVTEYFEEPLGEAMPAAFDVELGAAERRRGFEKSMAALSVTVTGRETYEGASFSCAVVHRARLDVECWLKPADAAAHQALSSELLAAFTKEDDLPFAEACRRLYGTSLDLDALFVDEKARIVKSLLHPPPERWWGVLRQWNGEFRRSGPLEPPAAGRLFAILEKAQAQGLPVENLPRLREAFNVLSTYFQEAVRDLEPEELREAARLTKAALALSFYPGRWELRLYLDEARRRLAAESRPLIAELERLLGFPARRAAEPALER